MMYIVLDLLLFSSYAQSQFGMGGTNGTYLQCAPPSFYTQLGIIPGDRSELRHARFLKAEWNSGVLVNDIIAILLREALGFYDSSWVTAFGTTSVFRAMENNILDLAAETWHTVIQCFFGFKIRLLSPVKTNEKLF